MMPRATLDHYRAQLEDATHLGGDDEHEIARDLYDEVERARAAESLLRAEHAHLVAAARAAVAAGGPGAIYLEHELARYGRMPPAGARPTQLLADAASLHTLLTGEGQQ